ncbi:MAG: aa3-type cytochrome c oxidase subunit IV [Pseudomonadota bacterium]
MSLDTSDGHPAMDYTEHKRTYSMFLKLTQITIVAVVLILLGMLYFLV